MCYGQVQFFVGPVDFLCCWHRLSVLKKASFHPWVISWYSLAPLNKTHFLLSIHLTHAQQLYLYNNWQLAPSRHSFHKFAMFSAILAFFAFLSKPNIWLLWIILLQLFLKLQFVIWVQHNYVRFWLFTRKRLRTS